MADSFTVSERLAWTVDRRLVPYESIEAAFLAYYQGQVIPVSEAIAVGLMDGKAEDEEEPEVEEPSEELESIFGKEAEPSEDKMVKAPANKGVQAKPEVKRKRGRPRKT